MALELTLAMLPSPIGEIRVFFRDEHLYGADFAAGGSPTEQLLRARLGRLTLASGTAPAPVREAFARYFDGDLPALKTLPLVTQGTPFQEQVWRLLRKIPPGRTVSYAELAETLGKPKALRAVGLANGRNPISVVIPCHRVIGKNGSLTGYGGGLERKAWLLEHERQASR
ncbi:MAG: methylated-DNA--[protein]-cysteine S-methyltransferase [Pseudomonadota bacterium]